MLLPGPMLSPLGSAGGHVPLSTWSLNFDGSSGYVVNSALSWPGGAISLSFWVNTPGGTKGSSFCIGGLGDPHRCQCHTPYSDNILYWDYGSTVGGGRVSTDFSSYLNAWAHVALVSSGSDNTFQGVYLNGSLAASQNSSGDPGALAGINIGRASMVVGGTFWENGKIDDFRLWNRVLSSTEISNLASGQDVRGSNFSGYWPFEEGSGTTTADSSGNGNTGTLTGGVTWSTSLPTQLL